MVDDIEDNSKLRRGMPVAHSIFGVPTVINGANYAYFLALEKCHKWQSKEAMNVSGNPSGVNIFFGFIFRLTYWLVSPCRCLLGSS
jgi:geranylgeranyl pyrophosphate synthase